MALGSGEKATRRLNSARAAKDMATRIFFFVVFVIFWCVRLSLADLVS